MFVASFAASLLVHPVDRLIGRKMTFVVGVASVGAAYTWMWFMHLHSKWVLGAALLLGFGCSFMLVTSLTLTSDLIGDHSVSVLLLFTSFCLQS